MEGGRQVDVEAELAEASCDVGGVEMQAVDLGALLLDAMHLLGRSAALLACDQLHARGCKRARWKAGGRMERSPLRGRKVKLSL